MSKVFYLSIIFFLSLMNLSAQVVADTTVVDSLGASSENLLQQKVDSLDRVMSHLESQSKEEAAEQLLAKKWKRTKYRSIAFVKQTLTEQSDEPWKWKSDFGVAVTMGRTYYLHHKPLFGMLKFGIDWTYFDVNYAKYSSPEMVTAPFDEEVGFPPIYGDEGGDGDMDLGCHQLEIGMQVGPSVTINPVDHLMVNGYFRFAPSASGIVINEEASINYASFFTAGGSVSYKLISLGVEARWGKAKYKNYSFADDYEEGFDEEDFTGSDVISKSKKKYKTSSVRFFISFRF